MSSHYVYWKGQVRGFDAATPKEARAKAHRWLKKKGYPGRLHLDPLPGEAHRGVA